MPLYEYECPVCKHRREELRPFDYRDSMAPVCMGIHAHFHKPAVCIRVDHAIAPTPAIDHMGKKEKK